MTADKNSLPEPDGPLQQVIADYLLAEASGRPMERAHLLARHPELAEELTAFFADHDQARAWAEPMCVAGVPPPTPASDAETIGHAGPSPADPQPGTVIRYFGDYELLDEVGRGGMGVVYKARQETLKRTVALKMILTGQLANEGDVKRFRAEAEAAARLDHPGIVPVFEVGHHEGHQYFSMAFVEGESLAHRLAQGLPSPRDAAELTKKVAEAVAYAHVEGVIHRDLKPANILIDKNGQPRLTDFGLAKRVEGDSNLTQTGQIVGTPSYMPPEQASGRTSSVGPLSDVYSLGSILYCLLTGRPPFQAATPLDTLMQVLEKDPVPPRQLNSSVPRDLETICLKCVEKEPRKRYGSARELGADLDRFLSNQPILARPATRAERAMKWMRRKPAAAALVAVSAAAAIALVAFGITLTVNARKLADEAGKREHAEKERGDLLTQQTELLNTQVTAARNHVYSSDVYLAGLALDKLSASELAGYLDGARPKPGEADLRGFEWYYLWRKNNSERLNLLKAGIVSAGPEGDETQRAWVERRNQLTEHRCSLAFSPDGKYLATTRDVCDAVTGKVLIEYDDVEGSKVFFSRDSTILFAGWRLFDLTKHTGLAPQERGKRGFTIPRSPEDRLVPLGFVGKLHFPSSSHTHAASSSRRSARAFNWAAWSGPDAAA